MSQKVTTGASVTFCLAEKNFVFGGDSSKNPAIVLNLTDDSGSDGVQDDVPAAAGFRPPPWLTRTPRMATPASRRLDEP